MKNILCYGDSNTWGFNPSPHTPAEKRFPPEHRWPVILGEHLGKKAHIIEEGLNGRTTAFEDPLEPGRNGLDWLRLCIETHKPLDLIIFMLGTNDTKAIFNLSAPEIAAGMEKLIQTAQSTEFLDIKKAPEILLIAPIRLTEEDGFGEFGPASAARSRALAKEYRRLAETYHCYFLDASKYTAPDPADGVHLNPNGQRALAQGIFEKLVECEVF